MTCFILSYFSNMFLRIFGFLISGIVSMIIYYEVSNTKFSSDEPNKDKLLVDLVSYVLDKLHYDPKIINDDFSINVYEDFIDAVDSQKRFLLKSDINSFSQYRLSIDDQIKSSDITFFNLVYETLKTRMSEVENFYEEVLFTPFNFDINEQIDLDYENQEYADGMDELKSLWRKRLKLSVLDGFASKKEINAEDEKIKSDSEIEKAIRLNAITDYHQCGTCAMGMGPNSVVDEQMRVKGIDSIRVLDASDLPNGVSGNINAPVMMVAARAADWILGNPQLKAFMASFKFND